MKPTKQNAPLARGAGESIQLGTTPANYTEKRKNRNCRGLVDCLAALHLHELEIDRVLDAIVLVEREDAMHWDDPRIAIRRAVQYLQRIGMATDAMLAGGKL